MALAWPRARPRLPSGGPKRRRQVRRQASAPALIDHYNYAQATYSELVARPAKFARRLLTFGWPDPWPPLEEAERPPCPTTCPTSAVLRGLERLQEHGHGRRWWDLVGCPEVLRGKHGAVHVSLLGNSDGGIEPHRLNPFFWDLTPTSTRVMLTCMRGGSYEYGV